MADFIDREAVLTKIDQYTRGQAGEPERAGRDYPLSREEEAKA